MKRKYTYQAGKKTVEREVNYIPVRYIIAMMVTVFELFAVIGTVVVLCYFVPYFYIAAWVTEIVCVIKIISSDDNPDYKVPWLLFVLILPIVGFMLYLIFSSRTLKRKYRKRLKDLEAFSYLKDDTEALADLGRESPLVASEADMLLHIGKTHIFKNTDVTYFPLGEEMMPSLIADLERAEKFIYMEYFIIEEGVFFGSILEVLKKKAANGIEIKLVYDDIGCMSTLPGNFASILKKSGIEATPFSRLRGDLDSEFNNRSHRKITVIDGRIAYTGGINLADEYINHVERFGHWKDTGVRLEGEAAFEMTKLFLTDFGINTKTLPATHHTLYPESRTSAPGFVIPFGDGPRPLYERRVTKTAIMHMLSIATRYVYMTSPYLIIDNELCTAIENAALRGVDVRIVVPHIPDKKLVFAMTRSFYPRLLRAGVRIFEYTPGFIHAKSYLVDDDLAIIGTVNLDYRSLVHHFENGVWLYKTKGLSHLKKDIEDTLSKSGEVQLTAIKTNLFMRAFRAIVRVFAPLL